MLMCLYGFLVAAVIYDYATYKIPNALIVTGLTAGMFLQGIFFRWDGLLTGIKGLLVIFVLGLPLFAIKALGAGDLKLYCVIAVYTGYRLAIRIIFYSLIFGAIIGILKLVIIVICSHFDINITQKKQETEKEERISHIWERLEKFFILKGFGLHLPVAGFFKKYSGIHFVHFSVAVLVAVIFCMEVIRY